MKKRKNTQPLDQLMRLHQLIIVLEKLEIERKRENITPNKIEVRILDLFEKSKEDIVLIQAGRVKFVNLGATGVIGYTPDEIMGELFANYIHSDELPRLAKYYQNRMEDKDAPIIYDTVIKHKNGSGVNVTIIAAKVICLGEPANFAIIKEIPEQNQGD